MWQVTSSNGLVIRQLISSNVLVVKQVTYAILRTTAKAQYLDTSCSLWKSHLQEQDNSDLDLQMEHMREKW